MAVLSTLIKFVAVANTGPMLSVFQCGRVDLLIEVFDVIYMPSSVVREHQQHGAGEFLLMLVDAGLVKVFHLTEDEKARAQSVAATIAASPRSRDPEPTNHLTESEAIVLAQRLTGEVDFILLDELAARDIAQQLGLTVTGFAGILRAAHARRLLRPDDAEAILRTCQVQGTHYSNAFIQTVVNELRRYDYETEASENYPT